MDLRNVTLFIFITLKKCYRITYPNFIQYLKFVRIAPRPHKEKDNLFFPQHDDVIFKNISTNQVLWVLLARKIKMSWEFPPPYTTLPHRLK